MDFDNPDHVEASPAIINGKLYLHDGAYNADNGSMFWTQKVGTPAVASGYVYFSFNSRIYCVDNETGGIMWQSEDQIHDEWAISAVYNGKVYSRNENGKVACFDGMTGDVVWEIEIQGDTISSELSLANGLAYLHSYEDRKFLCLNADTGEEVWSYETNRISYSKPVLIDGSVYLTLTNRLFSFNALTGEEEWEHEYESSGNFGPSPVVTDKYLYVNDGSFMLCLNREKGGKVWAYETGDSIGSSSAVVDGKIYFGSSDGWLYCIKAQADEDGYWPMLGYNPARTGSADEE